MYLLVHLSFKQDKGGIMYMLIRAYPYLSVGVRAYPFLLVSNRSNPCIRATVLRIIPFKSVIDRNEP